MQKDNDVEEKNKVSRETQKITVQQEIEIKDMENDCDMRMKKAMMELEKECVDEKLMVLEAIEAAKFCYSKRYFTEMRMVNNGEQRDPMTDLVRSYKQADKNTQ
jgi:hypothetical protein